MLNNRAIPYAKFSWILLSMAVILLGACKKTALPPPVEGDPVFSFSGLLGNEALDFVAGEDDYYMFSSFKKDELGVYSFIARFEKLEDCTEACRESLEIEIRDISPSANNSVANIEESLRLGIYDFIGTVFLGDTVLVGYDVFLENTSSSNLPLAYNWDFGDNTFSQERNPNAHFYPAIPNTNPSITLQVNSFNAGGFCSSDKTVIIQPDVLSSCGLGYTVIGDSVNVMVCANMNGAPPYTYEWTANGNMSSDSCFNSFNFSDSLDLNVVAMDNNGCSDALDIQLIRDFQTGILHYCTADFSYSIENRIDVKEPQDSLQLSKIIVRYTSPDGAIFSSDLGSQVTDNRFQILSSEDYFNNENGEKTRQLGISLNCDLYDPDGNSLRIDRGEGVIAIAYP